MRKFTAPEVVKYEIRVIFWKKCAKILINQKIFETYGANNFSEFLDLTNVYYVKSYN